MMSFCSDCGTELKMGAHFCSNCGASVDVPGQASPQKSVAAGQVDATIAGLGRRFAAHLVDAIVVFFIFFSVGSQVAEATGGQTESGFEMDGGPALLTILITLVISLAYMSFTEAFWNGQSLGKKLLGIAVVSSDGTNCTFGPALVRNLLRLVDGFAFYLLGLILALRSEQKQRFGDRIANTIVVKRDHGSTANANAAHKTSGVRFSMGRTSGSDYVD